MEVADTPMAVVNTCLLNIGGNRGSSQGPMSILIMQALDSKLSLMCKVWSLVVEASCTSCKFPAPRLSVLSQGFQFGQFVFWGAL